MSVTEINISESKVTTREENLNGGEIAVIGKFNTGAVDRVYTVDDAQSLASIFSGSEDNTYRYCEWLINKGNTLKICRAVKNDAATAEGSWEFTPEGESEVTFTISCVAVGPGAAYNNLKVKITPLDNNAGYFSVEVQDNLGNRLEYFPIVTFNGSDPYYYYPDSVKSNFIKLTTSGTVPESADFTAEVSLVGGSDGEGPISYTEAQGLLADLDVEFSILYLPELYGKDATKVACPILSGRKNVLLVVDVIRPDSEQKVDSFFETEVSYTIAEISNTVIGEDLSDFLSMVFPSVKVPGFSRPIPGCVAYADTVARLHRDRAWYKSPAGVDSGRLVGVTDVAVGLSDSTIRHLQELKVNPIINKLNRGVLVFGDNTATSNVKLIDNVPTRVLVNYLKRISYRISFDFLFEIHDESAWTRWKDTFSPTVANIKAVGGINAYKVIMDRTIMTEADIRAGILKGLIIIDPVSYIRKIYITFTVDETGVSLQEEVA